ncbi:MAG: hypothetical protein HQK57_03925 [Deltaproteobacteria bacterium]|nr:hypothetical protein [Deltaproteobacteria bacterium]
MALRLEKKIAEKAKRNQQAGGGDQKSTEAKSGSPNSVEAVKPIDTQKEVAAIAGIGHDTLSKVKRIESTGTPELNQAIQDAEEPELPPQP